jgi:uncharacterized protein (TIGR02186 family)
MRRCILLLLLMMAAPAAAADDESVTAGLSQDVIEITSTFSGADLTIFGAIENSSPGETPDIVVELRGPEALMTVRRKDRIAGLWINDASARLSGMSSFYFLAANRPLTEIASPAARKALGLGLDNLTPARFRSSGALEPYRQAVLRIGGRQQLYTENPAGVDMLSRTLFRVHVALPAVAPRGQYSVQVYLFRDGKVMSAQSTPLFVDQTGFERDVYGFAHNRPFAYGLLTVLMAAGLGWLSALAFRKRG